MTEETRTLIGGGATATIYDWDANGNLTRKTTGTDQTIFGYDALNRMVEVIDATGVKTYGYRLDGIRARESTPASTRRFLYSAEDILGIHDGTSYTSFFSHGPSVDEPLAQISQGTPSYLHHDGSGSITAISSTSGEPVGTRSYKPFGEIVDQTGIESRYGYTGREPDAAGLMYYRARYYQPSAGRFTTEDRFRGVPELPASQNRYAYAMNDPVNLTDPTGQYPQDLSFLRNGVLIGCRYEDPLYQVACRIYNGTVVLLTKAILSIAQSSLQQVFLSATTGPSNGIIIGLAYIVLVDLMLLFLDAHAFASSLVGYLPASERSRATNMVGWMIQVACLAGFYLYAKNDTKLPVLSLGTYDATAATASVMIIVGAALPMVRMGFDQVKNLDKAVRDFIIQEKLPLYP